MINYQNCPLVFSAKCNFENILCPPYQEVDKKLYFFFIKWSKKFFIVFLSPVDVKCCETCLVLKKVFETLFLKIEVLIP